ncbi:MULTISPECIES: hypothetical protein [unclassified Microcoleus]|uniref:hypothetical protein n=1 Tax=unclassified Microcoleus TaxID=2642155 RepID=UPI0025E915C2|nr:MULTISPECIES: hypothetical protein [unclassified Microcoleus]
MKKLKGTPYNELKIQRSNIWLDLLSSLPFIVVGLWAIALNEYIAFNDDLKSFVTIVN